MAKIAVISDFHFGFGWKTERKEDPFIQAREAIEKALDKGSKLIVIPGDIFDSRNPEQEVLLESMRTFSIPLNKKGKVKVIRPIDKELTENSEIAFSGVPIIAIHGTHERRGKYLVNPVQLLEQAGFLTHLHRQGILLNVNGEKIAVYGLSGVPERYARKEIEKWNPKPLPDAFNIFIFHQSIEQYIPSQHPVLNIRDLPKDFDLYINGHIHWQDRTSFYGSPVLFPGSTVRTQLSELEKKEKGFYMLDVEKGEIKKLQFIKLGSPRDFFYRKIEFEKEEASKIEKRVEDVVEYLISLTKKEKKPLIRILLRGSLKSGKSSDIDLSYIKDRFKEKAILSIGKDLKGKPSERVKLLRDLRAEKISIKEMGFKVLRKYSEELGYQGIVDLKELYELLSEEEVDKALKLVYGKLKSKREEIKPKVDLKGWT